jgi:hypothetical protein
MPFLHFDADPDLSPDPDPPNKVVRIRDHWSSDSQKLLFELPWRSWPSTAPCEPQSSWMLTLIRIQIWVPAFLSNAYPGQDPGSRNSDPCGSGSATLTRIMQDYVPCTSFISKIKKSFINVTNYGYVSWWYEWLILSRRVAQLVDCRDI